MSHWDGKDRREMVNQEDHDTLIRIETKLDRALGDVEKIDKRVAILEKGYWKVVGGVAVIVVLGDAVIKWLFK